MKQLIKDSMRISLKDLGQIYCQGGFLNEAQQQWNKSLEMSMSDEDAFHMRHLLAKVANQNGQQYLTEKFARDALDTPGAEAADPISATCLKVIHALHWAAEANYHRTTLELLELRLLDPEHQDRLVSELSQIAT